jgi:hypothetical protein
LLDALGGLVPPLLLTLERIGWVQRHLYPPLAARLAEELAASADAVAGPLRAVEALTCPDDLRFMRDPLVAAARQTLDLVTAFVAAAQPPGEPIGLFRALRRFARVQEALYPLAPVFEALSRWFLEPARRDDDALLARLRAAALVHGVLDWMFPVHTARLARQALQAAGARLVYREIEDLSHTYPRDENPRILDWLRDTATA